MTITHKTVDVWTCNDGMQLQDSKLAQVHEEKLIALAFFRAMVKASDVHLAEGSGVAHDSNVDTIFDLIWTHRLALCVALGAEP